MTRISFRKKLLILMAAIMLASTGVAVFIARQEFVVLREAKEAQSAAALASLLDKIDRNLFERYGDVQAFALSESARSGDARRMQAFMNDMMGIYAPVYDLMVVANARGRIVAVNTVDKHGKAIPSNSLLGQDVSGTSWFKAASAADFKAGASYVEDPMIDPAVARILGNTGKVMYFSAPIRDAQGRILGVWNNRMSWLDVVDTLVKAENTKMTSERIPWARTSIVSSAGPYLMHPKGSEFELKASAELGTFGNRDDADHRYTEANGEDVLQIGARSKGYSTYPGMGWRALLDVPAHDAQSTAHQRILMAAFALLVGLSFLAYRLINGVSRTLEGIMHGLATESREVQANADDLAKNSDGLVSASSEQAQALQQTAASMEEISAMVKKGSDSASQSAEFSRVSREVANRGQEAVKGLNLAIAEIRRSNEGVLQKVEESNVKINDIAQVISEIGNKTKVINDIVFQTKLLSFNASVEAARAGEHGKGFAVVAEEVGNLAQMSGNASKEIGNMLDSSIRQVRGIVDEMKLSVQEVVSESRARIDAGGRAAMDCGGVLDEIVQNVNQVSRMMEEISAASREQSTGISEINKAIGELDRANQSNLNIAEKSSSLGQGLQGRAHSLDGMVRTLTDVVQGERSKSEARSDESDVTTAPSTWTVKKAA